MIVISHLVLHIIFRWAAIWVIIRRTHSLLVGSKGEGQCGTNLIEEITTLLQHVNHICREYRVVD